MIPLVYVVLDTPQVMVDGRYCRGLQDWRKTSVECRHPSLKVDLVIAVHNLQATELQVTVAGRDSQDLMADQEKAVFRIRRDLMAGRAMAALHNQVLMVAQVISSRKLEQKGFCHSLQVHPVRIDLAFPLGDNRCRNQEAALARHDSSSLQPS